jgi:hypothetical protein
MWIQPFFYPERNVLALHGLNDSVAGSDFLIEATLEGIVESEDQRLGFMINPSPGAPNTEGFRGYTPNPQFSHPGGFYDEPVAVYLLPESTDDIIYYTLDMTTPGPDNGLVYNEPIQIDSTSALRAVVYRNLHEPSEVLTRTFIFIGDVLQQSPDGMAPSGFPSQSINNKRMDYGMDPEIINDPDYGPQLRYALLDIPSLSIVTDPEHLFDPKLGIYVNPRGEGRAWERPASFELLKPDGTQGFQINAGLRIRGAATRNPTNPKYAFRFIFPRRVRSR